MIRTAFRRLACWLWYRRHQWVTGRIWYGRKPVDMCWRCDAFRDGDPATPMPEGVSFRS